MITTEQATTIVTEYCQANYGTTALHLYSVLSNMDGNSLQLARSLTHDDSSTMGNVYRLMGAYYAMLTPGQQRADYTQAQSELASHNAC